MTDDHHDNRYEDGDDSTGTVEDYVDWSKPVAQTHTTAQHLRRGDVIEFRGQQIEIADVDNVDGWIEIVPKKGEPVFTRRDKLFAVFTPNR